MNMVCEQNQTILAIKQSPGNFVIFWNVIVPLSVLPSMLHFGLRKHELLLLMALLLNPSLMERISRNYLLSWLVVIFLVTVIYNVGKRWPWYNIYRERFLFRLFILIIFLAIPDMIITNTWTSMCKGVYTLFRSMDNSLKPAQIMGYGNSLLLIGASLLLLHAMYFYSNYHACACKFWMDYPQCKCVKPRPDRCKTSQVPASCKWFRTFMKTLRNCRN